MNKVTGIYCQNHDCEHYFEDNCMHIFETDTVHISRDGKCDDFKEGKYIGYLETWCGGMSDLISRESAIRAVQNYFTSLIEKGIHNVDIVNCNADIVNLFTQLSISYDMEKVIHKVREDAYSMSFDESQVEILIDDIRKGI